MFQINSAASLFEQMSQAGGDEAPTPVRQVDMEVVGARLGLSRADLLRGLACGEAASATPVVLGAAALVADDEVIWSEFEAPSFPSVRESLLTPPSRTILSQKLGESADTLRPPSRMMMCHVQQQGGRSPHGLAVAVPHHGATDADERAAATAATPVTRETISSSLQRRVVSALRGESPPSGLYTPPTGNLLGHRLDAATPGAYAGTSPCGLEQTIGISNLSQPAISATRDGCSPGFLVTPAGSQQLLLVPELKEVFEQEYWNLPAAATTVRLETRSIPGHAPRLFALVTYARPLIGYVLLAMGVIAWGSIGPLFGKYPQYIQDRSFLCGSWRYFVAAFVFTVLFFVQFSRAGMEPAQRHALRTALAWAGLIVIGAASCSIFCFYGSALAHTKNFSLVANLCVLHTFVMRIRDAVQGRNMVRGDYLAFLFGIVAVACFVWQDKGRSLTSIGLSIGSSLSTVVYLIVQGYVRPLVPFAFMMAVLFFVNFSLCLLLGILVDGAGFGGDISFSLAWTDVAVRNVTLGISAATILGLGGFGACMKFVSPLLVAAGYASEPAVGVLIDFLIGESTPQVLDVMGTALLLFAAVVLAMLELRATPKTTIVDVSEATHEMAT
eukprot:TRINITY_DN4168_c0_g1_i1.p1 TRINITY_DN4168_c0_g1~~TRINITY_DN4168_c0_g1_i1.p1  ORF type:complete len:628 (+),score=120.21 TRINITY_DN4168_c0_g1_i1:43-1884(+)